MYASKFGRRLPPAWLVNVCSAAVVASSCFFAAMTSRRTSPRLSAVCSVRLTPCFGLSAVEAHPARLMAQAPNGRPSRRIAAVHFAMHAPPGASHGSYTTWAPPRQDDPSASDGNRQHRHLLGRDGLVQPHADEGAQDHECLLARRIAGVDEEPPALVSDGDGGMAGPL